nr:uncharacterized protein LOC102075118 [Zonotrichia albicollis]
MQSLNPAASAQPPGEALLYLRTSPQSLLLFLILDLLLERVHLSVCSPAVWPLKSGYSTAILGLQLVLPRCLPPAGIKGCVFLATALLELKLSQNSQLSSSVCVAWDSYRIPITAMETAAKCLLKSQTWQWLQCSHPALEQKTAPGHCTL